MVIEKLERINEREIEIEKKDLQENRIRRTRKPEMELEKLEGVERKTKIEN